ncbi:MAG TPA: 50S ribosomal protein L9 [Balneolaceae bacterium]|nr:50S ribosomal protein L9 [Balneolaceae bacterium]
MANKSMKLILQESVDKLGEAGEIVEVKPGYGRNYLIPQRKAVMATEGALKQRRQMKEKAERRAEQTVKKAKETADRLENMSVTIPVQVGEEDRIHGTVTNQDVADALAERGIEIDRKDITIDQDIHTLGEYTATINLISELKPQIKVWVVRQ